MDTKAQFLSVYYNIPLKLRNEAILVLGTGEQKQVITWNVAFQEVSNDTDISKVILDYLVNLKII